jgi:hypothetical protein
MVTILSVFFPSVRLWSLHPQYLDPPGLVALWRESLLAQAVLHDRTVGYRHHPQLDRFREQRNPRGAIAAYLREVANEADRRGYRFDRTKIVARPAKKPMIVTEEELLFEWEHLRGKLRRRNPTWLDRLVDVDTPLPHPFFTRTIIPPSR